MNYCTYFDINYIKQGLALHASMEAHCQPYHLWILALCDETWRILTKLRLPNVTVTRMEAFETARLQAVRPMRTWQEYIWTLTGSWMLFVMGRHELESLSYIDADCYMFSSPEPIWEEIRDKPLAITPHRFPERLKHFEVNGLYNVGLLYTTKEGLPCIEEYAELCIDWCYYRNEDGKFADQGYFDALVPKYGVHVIQHLGVDLAPWNQEQYDYAFLISDKSVRVDGYRLIFYHFHQGFEPRYPIRSMVQDLIYKPYEKAIAKAEETLKQC